MHSLAGSRFLRALRRQPVDRTPVWLMRQAGRYLPEYRALRQQAGSFLKLCTTPELACEVTLQPLQRFPLDAAIVFSDILTIPAAMGLGLSFAEGEGPRFAHPIRSTKDVDRLGVPDPESDMGYVMQTLRLVSAELAGRTPLIGFAGSPWTLATYMVEGRSSVDYRHIKSMLFNEPADLHRLLAILATSVSAYLQAQILAGANAVMIFDTWGGVLGRHQYREFSLDYMRDIVAGLKKHPGTGHVPVILFTKGGGAWLEEIAASGCDALGIDWMTDLDAARQRVGQQVALQGNLDPATLYASPQCIRSEVARVLGSFGAGSGHVFNLGHGVQQFVDPERVAALVEAVAELSPQYHGE